MVSPAGRNPVASAWRFDSSLTDALAVSGPDARFPKPGCPVRLWAARPWPCDRVAQVRAAKRQYRLAGVKMCYGCNTEKPLSEFHQERSRKDGLATQCKACRSAHYKRTYPAKRDQIKANIDAYRRDLANQVIALKQRPCMDCGGTFPPYVMDFDHRDGSDKVNNISRLISRGNWARIEAEIAKCDLVCSNCHRIRSYARLRELGAVPERLTELPAKQRFAGSSPASASTPG